jgi:hypothetical protein
MRKYFIDGYNPKTANTKLFTANNEETAITVVDSIVAEGYKYVSVICLSNESPMTNWEFKGQTCMDGNWYDVYLMMIGETYND